MCPTTNLIAVSLLPATTAMSSPAPAASSSSSSSIAPTDASSQLTSDAEQALLLAAVDDGARIDAEQHEAQEALIEAEQSTRPLVGSIESLHALESEYSNNEKFRSKIETAARSTYPQFRRVRGDGNCFYRGYLFAILDWMSRTLRDEKADEKEVKQVHELVKIVEESLGLLLTLYDSFTMEEFHEYFLEQFQWILTDRPTTDEIVARLNDEGLDNYLISYARYLTSSFLAAHRDEYAPFVPDGRTVDEFRRAEIDPLKRESEHLQIVCLSRCLNVGVQILYLDQSEPNTGSSSSSGGAEEKIRTYVCPEGAEPRVHLLYRPGHYDVLVPASQAK